MKCMSRNTAATPRQDELYKAETTWFHVFKAMIDNGDIAKIGPYAVTVYLVIKSFTNFNTGLSFPSIETISGKSGISVIQAKRCLKILEENGYITKERAGKNNVYRLREMWNLPMIPADQLLSRRGIIFLRLSMPQGRK